MNLYLAKIDFQGDINFRLVKADTKKQAEDKIRELYDGYVYVKITELKNKYSHGMGRN